MDPFVHNHIPPGARDIVDTFHGELFEDSLKDLADRPVITPIPVSAALRRWFQEETGFDLLEAGGTAHLRWHASSPTAATAPPPPTHNPAPCSHPATHALSDFAETLYFDKHRDDSGVLEVGPSPKNLPRTAWWSLYDARTQARAQQAAGARQTPADHCLWAARGGGAQATNLAAKKLIGHMATHDCSYSDIYEMFAATGAVEGVFSGYYPKEILLGATYTDTATATRFEYDEAADTITMSMADLSLCYTHKRANLVERLTRTYYEGKEFALQFENIYSSKTGLLVITRVNRVTSGGTAARHVTVKTSDYVRVIDLAAALPFIDYYGEATLAGRLSADRFFEILSGLKSVWIPARMWASACAFGESKEDKNVTRTSMHTYLNAASVKVVVSGHEIQRGYELSPADHSMLTASLLITTYVRRFYTTKAMAYLTKRVQAQHDGWDQFKRNILGSISLFMRQLTGHSIGPNTVYGYRATKALTGMTRTHFLLWNCLDMQRGDDRRFQEVVRDYGTAAVYRMPAEDTLLTVDADDDNCFGAAHRALFGFDSPIGDAPSLTLANTYLATNGLVGLNITLGSVAAHATCVVPASEVCPHIVNRVVKAGPPTPPNVTIRSLWREQLTKTRVFEPGRHNIDKTSEILRLLESLDAHGPYHNLCALPLNDLSAWGSRAVTHHVHGHDRTLGSERLLIVPSTCTVVADTNITCSHCVDPLRGTVVADFGADTPHSLQHQINLENLLRRRGVSIYKMQQFHEAVNTNLRLQLIIFSCAVFELEAGTPTERFVLVNGPLPAGYYSAGRYFHWSQLLGNGPTPLAAAHYSIKRRPLARYWRFSASGLWGAYHRHQPGRHAPLGLPTKGSGSLKAKPDATFTKNTPRPAPQAPPPPPPARGWDVFPGSVTYNLPGFQLRPLPSVPGAIFPDPPAATPAPAATPSPRPVAPATDSALPPTQAAASAADPGPPTSGSPAAPVATATQADPQPGCSSWADYTPPSSRAASEAGSPVSSRRSSVDLSCDFLPAANEADDYANLPELPYDANRWSAASPKQPAERFARFLITRAATAAYTASDEAHLGAMIHTWLLSRDPVLCLTLDDALKAIDYLNSFPKSRGYDQLLRRGKLICVARSPAMFTVTGFHGEGFHHASGPVLVAHEVPTPSPSAIDLDFGHCNAKKEVAFLIAVLQTNPGQYQKINDAAIKVLKQHPDISAKHRIRILEGVPGCGKTAYIKSIYHGNFDVVICPTARLAAEYRDDSGISACTPVSAIAKSAFFGKRVVIEECFKFGVLELCYILTHSSSALLIGDSDQTSFNMADYEVRGHQRTALKTLLEALPAGMPRAKNYVSRAIPLDVVGALRDDARYVGLLTTNTRLGPTIEIVQPTSRIPKLVQANLKKLYADRYNDTEAPEILTFSKAAATRTGFKSVNAMQGFRSRNLALYVSGACITTIRTVPQQLYVAVTRHVNHLHVICEDTSARVYFRSKPPTIPLERSVKGREYPTPYGRMAVANTALVEGQFAARREEGVLTGAIPNAPAANMTMAGIPLIGVDLPTFEKDVVVLESTPDDEELGPVATARLLRPGATDYDTVTIDNILDRLAPTSSELYEERRHTRYTNLGDAGSRVLELKPARRHLLDPPKEAGKTFVPAFRCRSRLQDNSFNHAVHSAVSRYARPKKRLSAAEIPPERARLLRGLRKFVDFDKLRVAGPECIAAAQAEAVINISKKNDPNRQDEGAYGATSFATDRISCFNKAQDKAGLKEETWLQIDKAKGAPKAGQPISASPKTVNHMTMAYVRALELALLKALRPGVVLPNGMSPDQFEASVNAALRKGSPSCKYESVAMDISEQDTTKSAATHEVVKFLLRQVGVPEHAINVLFSTLQNWTCAGMDYKLHGLSAFQSGISMTYLNNTIDNMCRIGAAYSFASFILAVFKGDDSLLVALRLKQIFKDPTLKIERGITNTVVGYLVGDCLTIDLPRLVNKVACRTYQSPEDAWKYALAVADWLHCIRSEQEAAAMLRLNAHHYSLSITECEQLWAFLVRYATGDFARAFTTSTTLRSRWSGAIPALLQTKYVDL